MYKEDEEYKKRLEEAQNIISNINNNNNNIINSNSFSNQLPQNETDYTTKLKEAESIINSINPTNTSTISDEELLKTEQEKIDKLRESSSTEDIEREQRIAEKMDKLWVDDDNQEEQVSVQENQKEENQEDIKRKQIFDLVGNQADLETIKNKDYSQSSSNNTNETKEWNLLENIKSFFENLFLGGSSGVKQTLKYAETSNEQNFDNYKNIREKQYLTSQNVSEEEKASQKEASNMLFHNKNIQRLQLANNNLSEYGSLTKQPNDQKNEINLIKQSLQDSIDQDTVKIQENISNTTDPISRKLTELAPSLGQMGVGWGASAVNPMLGISYFMTSAGGSYIDDAKERGMNDEEAFEYGTIMGAMEGVTEEIGVSKLIKGGKALSKGVIKEALKNYGLNAADNFIQEAIIEPISEVTATFTGGKDTANWDDITGRMLQAGIDGALSALIMDGASAGINGSVRIVNKIRNNETITQSEIKNAINEINKNENIDVENTIRNEMNYQIQNNSDTDNYMLTRYNNENDNLEVYDVRGQSFSIENDKINIEPAVVKVGNYYNVIDTKTGLEVYTTTNTNKQDTISSFNELISNIDKAGIKKINEEVTNTKLALVNKLQEIERNPQLVQEFEVNNSNIYENNTTQQEYSQEQYRDITNTIEQISDRTLYNNDATINTLETVSNNVKNVNLIEQSGNYYLNSLDENGRVTYQQKIANRPYTGKKIKEIVNNAIQNSDTSYIYQEANTNNVQTSSEPNTSNFYSNETNYAVQDIRKATEPFDKQETYSKEEMAEIWNNEVSDKNYDAYYDSNGNIERYIAIEEDGSNIVVNQYDNNDNVVKSEVIPSQNGRYKASDIQDTLNRVASLYDENKPIKGQRDIEGNEVKSMKKNNKRNMTPPNDAKKTSNNTSKTSRASVSNNSITQNRDIIKSIEKFKKAKNTVARQDVINVATNLSVYHRGKTFIDDNMSKRAGNNARSKIIKVDDYFSVFSDKEDLRKQAYKYALQNYKNEVVTIKDSNLQIDIPQSGIKKTFGKNQDNSKMQTAPKLLDIIKESVYLNSSISTKNSSLKYHYFYTPVSIDNSNKIALITIKEDITNTNENSKFYYHDIREFSNIYNMKEGKAHAMPHKNVSNMLFEQFPPSIINNSIPQNTKFVKNTATNNSMQNNKNNTSKSNKTSNDNGVRTMKKNTSRSSTTQTNTTVDNQGRTLTKQQQEYFKDSKVRDENGNLQVVYHGTNNFGFTEFKRNFNFYTSREDVANTYTGNNGIYRGYLDIKNPIVIDAQKEKWSMIDINNIKINGIDNVEEFLHNQGTSVWQEKGKTRTSTIDLVSAISDAIDEGELSADGIVIYNIYDEGAYNNGEEKLGTDYITFRSNQFKNLDNPSPTSNNDIRFAKKTAKPKGEVIEPGTTNAQRDTNYIEQEIRKIEQTGNWDDSIPVTKMTDIRKTIENYLGLGVQKGHFRQQAYGIYKGNRDVIRTKELKDIDSILHETGHALDIGNRIKLNKENIADELLTAIDRYGGYEAETREVRLEEGFAEVIREYAIVPNQARIDYPQTVAVLEGIRQNDKSFDNFITQVQQQTYNYIHQNPRNRALSNLSIGESTDQTRLTPAKIQQEVMRNIYDKDWTLKSAVNEMQKINGKTTKDLRASENAYYLTRLSSGIGDKITSMLSKGYIDENGNKLMPGLEQLGEILGNDTSRFDDLRAYLVAQRDLEYKAKTLKTGIRTMDSRTIVEQFKNDTEIQEASKLVYDTLDGVMQYAVNNGLIAQDIADGLRESNAFYVPMQRVLEGNKNNVGRRGAVSDIIKARTGSELDVKDVLENIVANSANVIQQVENNNILKALYNQGEQAGMTGKIYDVVDTPMVKIGTAKLTTWENELKKQGVNTNDLDLEKTIDLFAPNNKIDANNLITSFINDNGKRVYLQFNDEVLFNSLMNIDKKFMSAVLNINRKLNMPLRYGATMANIGFAIPNMISDTAQAAIFSEAGFIPVVDNLIGVMDILSAQNKEARNFFNKIMPGYADRINTLYAIYEQSGATSSTRLSQYRESTQVVMEDVYGTKNSKVLGIKEKYKPLKRLLDIMTYIPEISEQSTRFRVFEKNLEYYRHNGLEETDARIKAALQSRDATQDFGRTGNITREINQLIPFSAARVGSAYTFAEKVKGNPKQVAMRTAVLMTLAMAIKGMGYDDDEIEELNQRKKDDNFVLKIGNQIVTIKKPQGILRSMVNLTEYVQDLFTGHIDEGKEGERLAELVQSAIMDNMPADSVTGLVPNMIAPVVENAINKDLYYNSDIVKSYDLELPDSEQYYDYNSQLAIWLGQVFDYSPAKIDNLISGYFAGLGTSVTNVIDWVAGKTGITPEQPEMGAEDNAVGKRFLVNVNSNSASVDEIYDLKTELTKKKNGGTITSAETQQLEAITNAISNMSKLNKQIKEIKKDSSMTGQEKAEQIKLLQQEKTDTARQALGKDLIYSNNSSKIQSTQFYPTNSSLSKSGYKLELTSEMKKEYEEIADEYYNKYASQGLYSSEKLEDIKSKAKDYAKNQLFKKYKSKLVKSK